MKSGNSRLQRFNAGMQQLAKLTMLKLQASRENKRLRQERDANRRKNWGIWHSDTARNRECARRRQQIAYAAGSVDRRALPRDEKLWITP